MTSRDVPRDPSQRNGPPTSAPHLAVPPSPIAVLLGYLPSRLETTRPGALDVYFRAKQAGLITGRIGVPDWLPPATSPTQTPIGPSATPDGVIVIPLDFAERLWAVTFGLLVLTDNDGVAARARHGATPPAAPSLALVVVASHALTEAMGGPLRPWPETIPTPDHAWGNAATVEVGDLAWWVGRANGVFLDALTYLALHEVSHLLQRHSAQAAHLKQVANDAALRRAAAQSVGLPAPVPSSAELEARQTALELEREADASAQDLLLGVGVDESAHFPRGFGAVMACTASLVLRGSFQGLHQELHPDLDTRLRQLLEALDAARASGAADDTPPDQREALWRLAAAGMRNAAHFWGARAPWPAEIRDWPRATALLFDHLETQKHRVVNAARGEPADVANGHRDAHGT